MDRAKLLPMPLADWEPTRLHWQLICQIVGKTRLNLHPFLNHWWHVTLDVSPRGLTTGPIPTSRGEVEIVIDVVASELSISRQGGESRMLPLGPEPIADFYRLYRGALKELEIDVKIVPKPYKCKSTEPFATDLVQREYDKDAVLRAWTALSEVDLVFQEFRGHFVGKCSPVHMFWHSFDLAVTRFSARRAPQMPEADRVTQEAYSYEVNSAGFWFGDDNLPEPSFYCYSAPVPAGLTDRRLSPPEAYWQVQNGSPMALLKYADLRRSADPKSMLLDFLQSSYEAGADAAGWDRPLLERPIA